MKKTFTLIFALAATIFSANAQPAHKAMTFAGKSTFYVNMMGSHAGETTLSSDTVLYQGSDFVLPSMRYKDMILPSFRITETTFTGDMNGVVWDVQTFTATATDDAGNPKNIKGTSLKGTFSRIDGIGELKLEVTFKYGSMPFPITYKIEGYYVKEYAGENAVTVGGQFGPYMADVVYKVRTYKENETTMMDVEIPSYRLNKTLMGDLALGAYIVKGLTWDESQGGYYKDYSGDNLTVHMTAKNNGMITMNGEYSLGVAGHENLLVEPLEDKVKITNHFQPGSMPFPIIAVMTQSKTSAIDHIQAEDNNSDNVTYNVMGQRVHSDAKSIVIRNGKKIFVK